VPTARRPPPDRVCFELPGYAHTHPGHVLKYETETGTIFNQHIVRARHGRVLGYVVCVKPEHWPAARANFFGYRSYHHPESRRSNEHFDALSLVSAIVVLLLAPKRSKVFALALAGFLLMIVALVVTLGIEVPIDRQIEQWTVATLPSDWKELRDRWEFYRAIRTFVSIGALGLMTTSSLIEI